MALIETISAFFIKLTTSKTLPKLVDVANRKTTVIKLIEELGLPRLKPNGKFESIYAHSLIEFVVETGSEYGAYQELFAHSQLQTAFKDGVYSDDYETFYQEVEKVFESSKFDKFRKANPEKADLSQALEIFASIYDEFVRKSASAWQIKKYYEDLEFQRDSLANQEKIKEDLENMQEENLRKSFDYQIGRYLENEIIDPFLKKYIIPNKYVSLIGHQLSRSIDSPTTGERRLLEGFSKRDMELAVDNELGEGKEPHKDMWKVQKQPYNPLEVFFTNIFNTGNKGRYQFVVMLGEYGTGKTTFFKFLAWALAEQYLDDEWIGSVEDPQKRIPILIPLREYNGEPFERFVVSHLNEYGVKDFDRGSLKEKFRDGKFILLLDGFDEMISREAETKKKYHADLLKDLLPQGEDSGSLVLLSSRKEYFKGEKERDTIFGTSNSDAQVKIEFLHLDTFNDQQIREFLEKNKEPDQDAEKLMKQINTIFDLKDLAKRAVLLELIIKYLPLVIKRRKNSNEPIRSVELYQEVFKSELERVKKDVFKGKPFLGSVKVQRQLLRNLALQLHISNELVFSYQEAEMALCELMDYAPDTQKRTIETDLTKFLTFSFLLNDGENQYRFSHKSFRDFLVAEAHYEEIQSGKTVEFGKVLNSDEVNTFLVEMQPDMIKLEKMVKNSRGQSTIFQFQGSNALKALLEIDKLWMAGKNIYNAEIHRVDFTGVDLTGCAIGDSILENCTWDMNMFELRFSETEIRGGTSYYWGKNYHNLTSNEKKEFRASSQDGNDRTNDINWGIWGGLNDLDLSDSPLKILGPFKETFNLNSLNLSGSNVTDLEPLKNLVNLNSLNLSGANVNDLEPLRSLINLNSLNLRGSNVNDLEPLKNLINLTSLNLSESNVNDLEPLKNLVNLGSLNLGNTRASSLESLRRLSNLTSLILWNTQVSDISPLKDLSNLKTLFLSQTRVSDIRPLAKLSKLQHLSLANTQVSDIRSLKELPNLKSLTIVNTQVSDIRPLKVIFNLKSLSLGGSRLKDIGVLRELSNLLSLTLFGPTVEDIEPLKELSNLNSLGLLHTQVSDLTPLEQLLNLKSLNLERSKVSDLTPLKGLIKLKSLDIDNTSVSDLGPLSQLSNLDSLFFSGSNVSDLGPLAKLSNLNLIYLLKTKVRNLSPLKDLSNLKTIGLSQQMIPDEHLEWFQVDCPNINLEFDAYDPDDLEESIFGLL